MREFYLGNGTEDDIEKERSLKLRRVESGANTRYGQEFPIDKFEKGVVETLNDLLLGEAEKLDVDFDRYFFPSDHIHLLDGDMYKLITGCKSVAVYRTQDDNVLINWHKVLHPNSYTYVKLLVHEILHNYSFQAVHISKDKKLNHKQITDYRNGYLSINPSERGHEHFRGLNEAVIERYAAELVTQNKERFDYATNGRAAIGGEQIDLVYQSERKVLDVIIKGLASAGEKEEDEIWTEMKRGLFNGNLLHLKDVDKVFGKGSLRVLAALGQNSHPSGLDKFTEKKNELILKYFESKNESERRALALEILNERERGRYLRMQSS